MTAITSGLARGAKRAAALEEELGRAAMLDRAIESDDHSFKFGAAFTIAFVTALAILDEAEQARQAGKDRLAEWLNKRLNKMLRGERERVTSQPN
jgi:hypothetical protein